MLVNTPQALGLWFQHLRKEIGMTQVEVAEAAGVKQKTISGFENGKINIQIDTLMRLLAVINAVIDLKSRRQLNIEGILEW